MSEQVNQEKVSLTKDQMHEALESQVNGVMDALISDESFSEEQRGQVKVWLKQLYQLGKEHGKSTAVIEALPEDAIDKFVGVFQKVAEATNPNADNDGKDYKLEAMLYRLLYNQEKQISDAYKFQICMLQQTVDGTFGTPNAYTCRGMS